MMHWWQIGEDYLPRQYDPQLVSILLLQDRTRVKHLHRGWLNPIRAEPIIE